MRQLITPNPDIECRPGWCLQYVRQTYDLPARYNSATEAWEKSDSKHYARDFPTGCWVPVWYAVKDEPLGHVVLLAPDGTCYSTSTLTNTPYHHPSLTHLESFYRYYNMDLTYRGWTEDVAGFTVVEAPTINVESTTIETGLFNMLTEQQQKDIYWQLCTPEGRKTQADLAAAAILDAPVKGLDSQGNEITTTLRTKIRYMAPNHSQLHGIVSDILVKVSE